MLEERLLGYGIGRPTVFFDGAHRANLPLVVFFGAPLPRKQKITK
jgi:hypothetical protein